MKKVSPHPEWALKCKKPGTELRNFGGKYYLYQVTSIRDKETKKTKKITGPLLGRITEKDGFIESDKYRLKMNQKQLPEKPVDLTKIAVREYGATKSVTADNTDIYNKLQACFPEHFKEIFIFAFLRLLYQSPIKRLNHHFSHSYLQVLNPDARINDKFISQMLRTIGQQRENCTKFMKSISNIKDEQLLIDMTNIITRSKNIELAHKGYNNKKQFDPQVNLMLLFSETLNQPTYFRIVPGNVREVKAFETTLNEAGIKDAILIADKGFYSQKNINELQKAELKYILPLRRNSTLIDYKPFNKPNMEGMKGYFKYVGRYIWYYTIEKKGKTIYVFLDKDLKKEEEEDYLDRIESSPETHKYQEFKNKMNSMGTLSLITNMEDKSPEEIYSRYKTRNKIEQTFDTMKNIIEADKTYMQDNDALQGWFFVNYIATLFYYKIYNKLIKLEMIAKYSINDILQLMIEVKKISINGNWVDAEVNTKSQKILKPFLECIT